MPIQTQTKYRFETGKSKAMTRMRSHFTLSTTNQLKYHRMTNPSLSQSILDLVNSLTIKAGHFLLRKLCKSKYHVKFLMKKKPSQSHRVAQQLRWSLFLQWFYTSYSLLLLQSSGERWMECKWQLIYPFSAWRFQPMRFFSSTIWLRWQPGTRYLWMRFGWSGLCPPKTLGVVHLTRLDIASDLLWRTLAPGHSLFTSWW